MRLYRDHLSDFPTWKDKEHAEQWLVFPENIGAHLSLDEVAISNGELYTVLTNKARHGKKGCLVTIVKGTVVNDVVRALERIPVRKRDGVKTVTRDLDDSMTQIATIAFPHAEQIDDRFHVQQLLSEAVQELRIVLRKEAIKEHNTKMREAREKGKYHKPHRYENGDTLKELLARGRHILFKSSGNWTESQCVRARILFQEFPQLQQAYEIAMSFRGIYEQAQDREDARERMQRWYAMVMERLETFPNFETPLETIQLHEETIINYFKSWKTNASAESFNAKIKNFRALQRGVSDVTFFLFRLSKIYG